MIKIFLTVRNRLAITKKCVQALKEHSSIKHQIYVYNNATNFLLEEHFKYFYKLFNKKLISQVTFTTEDSTFNAFSKAAACNYFGKQHEEDPNKDSYNFLVMLDNDIIVTPGWDAKLHEAWKYVVKHKMIDIKVIAQLPGGIKYKKETVDIGKMRGSIGKLGGSGLWSVRPNFFRDVGYLDLTRLVGQDKKHDQMYWLLMDRAAKGRPYIMGLDQKLGIHCGRQAGSVCNRLTRHRGKKDKYDMIKFPQSEKRIASVDFKTFFEEIYDDKKLLRDW
jgi:hypothetical protein